MKKKFIIIAFCLGVNTAFSADLYDVKIIDIKNKKNNIELKLQTKDGLKDSYFIVDIVESDKAAFDKIAVIIKKIKKGKDYKLDLSIPSFSAFPSGSYYRSDSVTFKDKISGDSLIWK